MASRSEEQDLHKAIRDHDLKRVAELLDHGGISVDCLFYGWTPLLVAVKEGDSHCDIVELLLTKGASPHFKDEKGMTPFQEAVLANDLKIVKLLLNHGADVNQTMPCGHTALTLAIERGWGKMCTILIEAKTDLNKHNLMSGETALYNCATGGNANIMKLLISSKADINLPCSDSWKHTPLIAAVSNENVECVKLIVKAGSDLNTQDVDGWTALMHAVYTANEDTVRCLIKSGADSSIINNEGKTAVDMAQDLDDEDMLIILRT